MSKWILASLIFINSGPFLMISKDASDYNTYLLQSASYFIVGIALAVLCGFLAWLNSGMRELLANFEVKNLRADPDLQKPQGKSLGESITTTPVRSAMSALFWWASDVS